MIEKIENSQIQNLLGNSSPKKDASKATQDNIDASLQINSETLMQQAADIPIADDRAVAQAEKLLQSGQLDTIENIRQAAANILDFGI